MSIDFTNLSKGDLIIDNNDKKFKIIRIISISCLVILSIYFFVNAAEFPDTISIKGKIWYKEIKTVENAVVYIEKIVVFFLNDDSVLHNIHAYDGKKTLFNKAAPKNMKAINRFKDEGEFLILCDVHPEMSAYIVSLQNRLFSVTDKDGNFNISGAPPGTYTLNVWHEKYELDKAMEITAVDKKPLEITFHLPRKKK